jgi:hypothetical protein
MCTTRLCVDADMTRLDIMWTSIMVGSLWIQPGCGSSKDPRSVSTHPAADTPYAEPKLTQVPVTAGTSHLWETPVRLENRRILSIERADKRMLMATGHGDLGKGILTCRRVADMAARAELAKLIRVRIVERSVDHVREQFGRNLQQEIDVVREELVEELLRGVSIVERSSNRAEGMCSSTAVMSQESAFPMEHTR